MWLYFVYTCGLPALLGVFLLCFGRAELGARAAIFMRKRPQVVRNSLGRHGLIPRKYVLGYAEVSPNRYL